MPERIYIQSPEFRVSFPNVFKPRQYMGKGDAKFNCVLLFSKGTNLDELKDACRKVAREEWGANLKDIKWPFKDGDVHFAAKEKAGKKGFEAYKGMIFCSASTTTRPQVIQPDAKTYIDGDETAFYAGCHARTILNPFTYENEGRGVSFGLGNIQKTRDDEKFGGRPPAEDQFDPVQTGADDPSNYPDDDMIDSGPAAVIDLS